MTKVEPSMATVAKHQKKNTKSEGSINKAEEIRKAAKELGGKKVRPKDVIALLETKGITVSSPQVSATLKAAGYRRTRRGKTTGLPKVHHASQDAEISLEHLLAAKALASKLGSLEAAKKALDVLAKLA
jgi:hypothetical protein